MFEPRGHNMMAGSILYPPSNHENEICILFIETNVCLPMCGHGTIRTVTIMIQDRLLTLKRKEELRIEVPTGLVYVQYNQKK